VSYRIPATRGEASRYLNELDAMLNTEGWRIFASQMQTCKDQEMQTAAESSDAHATYKALGAAKAHGRMLEWPEKTVQALREALKSGELPE
jgi:hypothetical protein